MESGEGGEETGWKEGRKTGGMWRAWGHGFPGTGAMSVIQQTPRDLRAPVRRQEERLKWWAKGGKRST